jgi:hypothetical protein
MVVSNKKNSISNKKLLSLQLKKAIFYAFYEAKKQGSEVVDSYYILYGLLKVDSSLATRLVKKVFKDNGLGNSSNNLLNKIKLNINTKRKKTIFSTNKRRPNFSRPVRKLLFFLIKSTPNEKKKIVTTLDVFKYLLRNKYISKWVNDNSKQLA